MDNVLWMRPANRWHSKSLDGIFGRWISIVAIQQCQRQMNRPLICRTWFEALRPFDWRNVAKHSSMYWHLHVCILFGISMISRPAAARTNSRRGARWTGWRLQGGDGRWILWKWIIFVCVRISIDKRVEMSSMVNVLDGNNDEKIDDRIEKWLELRSVHRSCDVNRTWFCFISNFINVNVNGFWIDAGIHRWLSHIGRNRFEMLQQLIFRSSFD